jgi:predicted ester cyclase
MGWVGWERKRALKLSSPALGFILLTVKTGGIIITAPAHYTFVYVIQTGRNLNEGKRTLVSIEENKELVRRLYDLDNKREKDAQYELIAPACVFHMLNADLSVEQFKEFDAAFYAAFPDIYANIEDIIAEGDKVAFRLTFTGTNTGKFMGNLPTGKKIDITHTNWVRVVDGKVVEYWNTSDGLLIMQQLGVIPSQ